MSEDHTFVKNKKNVGLLGLESVVKHRVEISSYIFLSLVSQSFTLREGAELQNVHISNELCLELLTKIFLELSRTDEGELS